MSWRSRAYEKYAYRSILSEYQREDPDFLWTSAPHPSLKNEFFNDQYHDKMMKTFELKGKTPVDWRLEQISRGKFVVDDFAEPVFDAADAIRCFFLFA